MIYSQCFVALSHWGNERVRKWGTEAVKRRAAVKLMQMPRTGGKRNGSQMGRITLPHLLSLSLLLASSSKWDFNIVTCGRDERMCREQSFPSFISLDFPTWSNWLPCTHGSSFWLEVSGGNGLPVLSPFVLTAPIFQLMYYIHMYIQLSAQPAWPMK